MSFPYGKLYEPRNNVPNGWNRMTEAEAREIARCGWPKGGPDAWNKAHSDSQDDVYYSCPPGICIPSRDTQLTGYQTINVDLTNIANELYRGPVSVGNVSFQKSGDTVYILKDGQIYEKLPFSTLRSYANEQLRALMHEYIQPDSVSNNVETISDQPDEYLPSSDWPPQLEEDLLEQIELAQAELRWDDYNRLVDEYCRR